MNYSKKNVGRPCTAEKGYLRNILLTKALHGKGLVEQFASRAPSKTSVPQLPNRVFQRPWCRDPTLVLPFYPNPLICYGLGFLTMDTIRFI